MKEQNITLKTSFFKKTFVKICRIFGYEIIDQNNFYVPTQEKALNANLNCWNFNECQCMRNLSIRPRGQFLA